MAATNTLWTEIPLGELVEFHDSKRIPLHSLDRAKRSGTFPYYGASGIVDYLDDYIFDGEYLLVSEDGENLSTRNTPIAFIATGRFWVNNHAHILQGKRSYLNKYLLWFLNNANISPHITGAVQPKLSKTNLASIPVLLPKEEKAREAIVLVLSSLDDKIELLRKQSETLEQIVQAIFNEWFVKLATDSTLPDGWKMGTLGEEFQITMGQSPKGETFNENGDGMIFFQGRTDFQSRFPKTRLYTTTPVRVAEPSDVLVSVRAPVGDINVALEQCCIGRGLAAIRGNAKSYTLYKILSMQTEIRAFDAEGTVFGSVSKTDLANIPVAIPSPDAVARFEAVASPFDQKILNNSRQAGTLSRVRDLLLPRLMSGEIRV